MEQAARNACLSQIESIWLTTAENMRPFSVWITEHQEVLEDVDEPTSSVLRVWYLDENGIFPKSVTDYARFHAVQLGKTWATGAKPGPSSAIFNSREGRIHEIGVAKFAPLKESSDFYIGYVWGGTFGLGAIYSLGEAGGSMVCVRNIWRS